MIVIGDRINRLKSWNFNTYLWPQGNFLKVPEVVAVVPIVEVVWDAAISVEIIGLKDGDWSISNKKDAWNVVQVFIYLY